MAQQEHIPIEYVDSDVFSEIAELIGNGVENGLVPEDISVELLVEELWDYADVGSEHNISVEQLEYCVVRWFWIR